RLADPPLGEATVDRATRLVLGLGEDHSAVRVTGGEGARAEDFRRRARIVTGVPIVVALGGGVAVRGPLPAASAVVRALVVQLALRFRPSQLAIAGDGLADLGLATLPHARRSSRG